MDLIILVGNAPLPSGSYVEEQPLVLLMANMEKAEMGRISEKTGFESSLPSGFGRLPLAKTAEYR